MKRKYGVVLVGCGYMGAAHLEGIYFRKNIEIRGVVDVDATKAQFFMRKYGALSYSTDYATYLKDPKTDIVIIATYPSTHLEILRNCTLTGKHVLCEKPVAVTYEEALEFEHIVRNSEVKVLAGHVLRHNSTYRKVAGMISNGEIGRPVAIRIVQNKHAGNNWSRYLKLMQETSPLIDCGVHYADVMQWFTGSHVVSVSGTGMRTEPDVPESSYNYCIVNAKLSDGSIAYYESGWGNTFASEDLKEIVGPKGRIRIIYQQDRVSNREEGDLIEFYKYPENEYRTINNHSERKPIWEQFQYLIRMIEDNIPPFPDIDQVMSAFKIVLAADRAISSGQRVDI